MSTAAEGTDMVDEFIAPDVDIMRSWEEVDWNFDQEFPVTTRNVLWKCAMTSSNAQFLCFI